MSASPMWGHGLGIRAMLVGLGVGVDESGGQPGQGVQEVMLGCCRDPAG